MNALIEAAVRGAVTRVAERVREAVPALQVEADEDRLTVRGHRVREALGWIGGLLR